MEVEFRDRKTAKMFNSRAKLEAKFGAAASKAITLRVGQLHAVSRLEEMRTLPGRTHELTGDLKGLFAVDLRGPYRLLFYPSAPVPMKDDGGIDWCLVTKIVVSGVEDYHGR